ncbi:hypothetical protein PsalMR5_04904 (plasmid) [Piscirickettsia salmonis]|uniref:hypothetical protein n=1 Tax=Piscirickettsia salmonis TaxID=1238 RepID=UPI0012BB14E7|nr:hypothetical protein [Piscirickettsia salmonis]QGP57384.1 hypothetical protein PsalSR1_04873 [Piscirickettsia salmonis]QGP66979.1 hypothetical protein PsalMR5_04904 [Piscirickettsia salmonis]
MKKIAMILSSTLLMGSIAYGDNSAVTVTVYNDTAYRCDTTNQDDNGVYSISSCEHNNNQLDNMYVGHYQEVGKPDKNVVEISLGESEKVTTYPSSNVGGLNAIALTATPEKYYFWEGGVLDVKNGESYYVFLNASDSRCINYDTLPLDCYRFTKQNPISLTNTSLKNAELLKKKFFQ